MVDWNGSTIRFIYSAISDLAGRLQVHVLVRQIFKPESQKGFLNELLIEGRDNGRFDVCGRGFARSDT